MIWMKPCAVPSSLITSGRPTTVMSNSTAITKNSLNRNAAFQVNPAMARILCTVPKWAWMVDYGWVN